MAYLDDVGRFSHAKQVGSYLGLVPSQDSSGPVNRLGHITRQGPPTARKLLVESARQSIRRSPTVAAYYRRVRRDDPDRNKVALVATAHYLARVMFPLLRKQEDWKEAAWRRPPREPGRGAMPQNKRVRGKRRRTPSGGKARGMPYQ